jgi:glucose/arabinose dehydrogenase
MLNMMSGWFGADAPGTDQFGGRIRVPEGFAVGLFAAQVPGVRFLRPLPNSALLATSPREGTVWRLEPDRDGDGRADGVKPLLENLKKPHGLDLFESWLYVAEGDGVGRVRIDPRTGDLQGKYERVVDGLPEGGNHWSHTVRFGPDGWMYVSVGSSCNVCTESDPVVPRCCVSVRMAVSQRPSQQVSATASASIGSPARTHCTRRTTVATC